MSWGTDIRLYLSGEELRNGLASRLTDRLPRALKQQRGMGGQRIWRVELETEGETAPSVERI